MLEKASEMDLYMLSDYYKENRYNFLRDAIILSVSSLECGIDDLKNVANLFSYDEAIYGILQNRIEAKQHKLYAAMYYRNCDSLISVLEYIVSEETANYIGDLISGSLVDSIFADNLPEDKKSIDKKARYWVNRFSKMANDKILSLFQQFADEELTTRRNFVDQNHLPYYMGAQINIRDIGDMAVVTYPHQSKTYSELYLISEKQNETDWVGWGLTAAEWATFFLPGGQLVSTGIGLFSAGRDVARLNEFREDMKRYGTNVSKKIFNDLQEECNQRIQYMCMSIKYAIKNKLEL
jgi:hypothetical protein